MTTEKPSPSRKQRSQGRRSILKKIMAGGGVIAAGGALPDRWRKPVIDSAVLPAHAQSSPKGSG